MSQIKLNFKLQYYDANSILKHCKVLLRKILPQSKFGTWNFPTYSANMKIIVAIIYTY